MKTQRFSFFAGFAARERMREAKPVKLKKVAFSHFFDTLRNGGAVPFVMVLQFSRASVQYSAPYISVSRKVERAFSCAMLTLVMVSSPSTVIWLPSI